MSKFFKEAIKTRYTADELEGVADKMHGRKDKWFNIGALSLLGGAAGTAFTGSAIPFGVGAGIAGGSAVAAVGSKTREKYWKGKAKEVRKKEKETGQSHVFKAFNLPGNRIKPVK